ncbi:1,6-anhydro-N-acetylmuramyl-L-alanine amidase [hydrothermal vent metagenome]|uniref:N-acetylmuramoyl-L-alanine amidase n=1 Tax=hydrothermal vent metagenome TaxID=652676 RepID=A0A3B0QUE8_9ZZZZ
MQYYEKQGLNLKRGDKGADVRELQSDLISLAYNITAPPDGDYGWQTEKAVRSFQAIGGADVTGVVDYEVARALHKMAVDPPVTDTKFGGVPFIICPHYSSRKGEPVDMIVIHYTASGSLDGTTSWFQGPESKVSAHYLVGKDGSVVQMVKEADKAWHAGTSEWMGRSNCNVFSIGIEIINWGILQKKDDGFYCAINNKYTQKYNGETPVESGDHFWEPYTGEQYEALAELVRDIIQRRGIEVARVVGHSDIAPVRKTDPGAHFDWARFRKSLAVEPV